VRSIPRAGRGARAGAAAATAALALVALAATAWAKPLQTGFADPLFSSGDPGTRATWLDRARKARAKVIRIDVSWRSVAPAAEPSDPTDPAAYDWGTIPAAVEDADARGLKVLLTVSSAPDWAEAPGRPPSVPPGTWRPDASKFGQFGRALAAQFAGDVRHYQAWNEPNLWTFLNPQYEGKTLVAPDIYRRMLNAFYEGVHAVQRNAVVVSAGTAPYGEPPGGQRTRPLRFLREVLCLKNRRKLKPVKCSDKAKLDALAHHPINTSGGPRRSAAHPDDASTPDVRHVVRTLRKAEKRHRVSPRGHRQVWLTEFWWESKPPDPCTGIPLRRHARWIGQALRSFKKQGARVAINFQIRDAPFEQSQCGRASFQSGVFFVDGGRKPAFRSFRKFNRRR
jgi:hypothetical protein